MVVFDGVEGPVAGVDAEDDAEVEDFDMDIEDFPLTWPKEVGTVPNDFTTSALMFGVADDE
jgi:hypothetical protein